MRLHDDATAFAMSAPWQGWPSLIPTPSALPQGTAPYSIFIPVRSTTFFESL